MLAPLLMKAGLQSVTASQHLVTILLHLAVQNMLLQEKMLKQADLKKGGNRQMETKSASIPPAWKVKTESTCNLQWHLETWTH